MEKEKMNYYGSWLNNQIEEILLEFAGLYNEVTTSDLQGIATVKANEIIKLMEEIR